VTVRATTAIAAAVALSALPGCAALDKRQDADLLRGAAARIAAQKTVTGTLRSTVTVKRTRIGTPPPPPRPATTSSVRIDLTTHRSSIDAPAAAGGAIPVTLFSEDIVYQRRIGQAGSGTTEGRPWVKLSFESLKVRRALSPGSGYGYADALNPAYLLDMLRGTLTGSVERRGQEDVGGTSTTRYDVNIGLDKAFKDVPERRRDGIEAYTVISGISLSRVAPATVWLGADGLPRRIQVTMSQRPDIEQRADVTYELELASFGAPLDLHLPKRKEIATVDTMGPIIAATSAATATPGTGGLPMVLPTSTVPAVTLPGAKP
jgi:hypothetical protein